MKWLIKCLFGHTWRYSSGLRECRNCGKKQDATYDMMYGTTQWEDRHE